MKIAVLIARLLLGLLFAFSGLNNLFHFMHAPPPMPNNDAGHFADVMMKTHYMTFVGLVQTIGGLLLLIGRYVPLGLTLLGPVLVNILLFHITMMHQGLAPGLVATALWLVVFWGVRQAFAGIFAAKVEPTA